MRKIECDNLNQISDSAKLIIDLCEKQQVWVFKGDLGAGKTTMIKEIARQMGVIDPVSSPTFSIVNEYEAVNGATFYHFDFFRIEDPREALEIGVDEYFYSGNYCWVEWGEKIPELIPEEFALIEICQVDKDKREIFIKIINNGNGNRIN